MGDRPVENAAPPSTRDGARRKVLAATLPPLGAALAQWLFWMAITRWSLFYPAVFLSSWLGGFRAGLASIALSVALIWTFFFPHDSHLVDARHLFATFVFVAMGYIVCELHRNLRHAMRVTADALADSQRVAHELQAAINKLRIYEALIDNSPDFIGMADATGKPFYINHAGREMVGLTDDYPVSKIRIPELYPEELRRFALDVILKESLQKGTWLGETTFRHWITGARIPVSQRNFMIRDPKTDQLLGIGTINRDISEIQRGRDELMAANRDLAEKSLELAKNQRFLQAIMNFTPNVIAVKDLKGRYVLTNRRLQEILGISEATAKGKTDAELFPADIAEHHRTSDAAILKGKRPITYEQAVEVNGEPRFFLTYKFPLHDDNDQMFAICAIWSDVTELKRVEEALRDTAAGLLAAEKVAHVGSWRWNRSTGMARWSEELYRIFGRDPDLPVPKLLSEDSHIFTPPSFAALAKAADKLLADGTPYELDLELQRPDGTTRWVAARGEPLRDEKGTIIGITGTARDVTELKELQRLRDEWTSVIAHDLRQPIGTITMAADFLPELHPGAMEEREKAVTARIRAAARALARMVDDLMDLSLLEANRLSLDKKWVEPRALVEETLAQLGHLTQGRRVTVTADRQPSRLFVDPLRLGQVLTNLLSNAVKYGDKSSDIEVKLLERRGELEITVTNRGPGVSPEELPNVFTRFMRSKAMRKSDKRGLGLGLYISKGLVEAHGGRIWVDSTPGKTTTFHCALPKIGAAKEVA